MNWEGLQQDIDLMRLLARDMKLPTKARQWASDWAKRLAAVLALKS